MNWSLLSARRRLTQTSLQHNIEETWACLTCRIEILQNQVDAEKKRQVAELESLYCQFKAFQAAKEEQVAGLLSAADKCEPPKTLKKRDWSPAGAANRRKLRHSSPQTQSHNLVGIITPCSKPRVRVAQDLLRCAEMGEWSLASLWFSTSFQNSKMYDRLCSSSHLIEGFYLTDLRTGNIPIWFEASTLTSTNVS